MALFLAFHICQHSFIFFYLALKHIFRFVISHYVWILSHLTFFELIPTKMFVVNGKKKNHRITLSLNCFPFSLQAQITTSWWWPGSAVFSWKERDDHTYRNIEKNYFLMQFMLTAQKFNCTCNVGCTSTVTLITIADSLVTKPWSLRCFARI